MDTENLRRADEYKRQIIQLYTEVLGTVHPGRDDETKSLLLGKHPDYLALAAASLHAGGEVEAALTIMASWAVWYYQIANRIVMTGNIVFAEDAIIQFLQSMPYDQYLQTAHWKRTRKEALNRAKHRCQVCNTPKKLQVHHRTYERRGEELPEDLTVLCDNCHETFHKSKKMNPNF